MLLTSDFVSPLSCIRYHSCDRDGLAPHTGGDGDEGQDVIQHRSLSSHSDADNKAIHPFYENLHRAESLAAVAFLQSLS